LVIALSVTSKYKDLFGVPMWSVDDVDFLSYMKAT